MSGDGTAAWGLHPGICGFPLKTAARLKMHRDTVRRLLRRISTLGRKIAAVEGISDAPREYTAGPVPAKKGKRRLMPMDREVLKKWILDSRAEMTAALTRLLDKPGISIADRKRLTGELKALERAKENDDLSCFPAKTRACLPSLNAVCTPQLVSIDFVSSVGHGCAMIPVCANCWMSGMSYSPVS